MIIKFCCRFSVFEQLPINKTLPPQESQKLKDYSEFLKGIEEVSKSQKFNSIDNYLQQFKQFNSVEYNLETMDWLFKNNQNQANQIMNNMLGNQIILLQKSLQQNKITREFLNQFSLNFENLHAIMNLNVFYIVILIQYLSLVQTKFGSLNDNEQKALLLACDSYKNQIVSLYSNYISTQLFYISNLNISIYSVKLFFELFVSFTKRLSKCIEDQNDFQLKSIYYSLGKNGFYDKKIRNFLLQKLEQNVIIKDENQFQGEISLILCTTNLFYNEIGKQFIKQKIKTILDLQKLYWEKSQNQICSLYQQILRFKIYDYDVWEIIFNSLPQLPLNYQKAQLIINLIDQKSKFQKQQNKQIKASFEPMKQQMIEIILESRKKFSSKIEHHLETNIQQQIDQLGLDYEKNKLIDQYEIDFYFPKYNLILEICGPSHYSYNIQAKEGIKFNILNQELYINQNLNLVSVCKKEQLEYLGYKVLYVNYQELREINIQSLILKSLIQ